MTCLAQGNPHSMPVASNTSYNRVHHSAGCRAVKRNTKPDATVMLVLRESSDGWNMANVSRT